MKAMSDMINATMATMTLVPRELLPMFVLLSSAIVARGRYWLQLTSRAKTG
jgi:hypothetical protein